MQVCYYMFRFAVDVIHKFGHIFIPRNEDIFKDGSLLRSKKTRTNKRLQHFKGIGDEALIYSQCLTYSTQCSDSPFPWHYIASTVELAYSFI